MAVEWIVRSAVLLFGALLAAVVLPLLVPALQRGGSVRTNYRGEEVVTSCGLVFPIAALFAAPLAALAGLPALAALLAFSGLGWIDDRFGDARFRGLRGHLQALRQGVLSSGIVKAVGGLGAGLALGAWLHPDWRALPTGLTIALAANAVNLLDLRPLRALKGFALLTLAPLALPGGHGIVLAAVWGAAFPYLRLERRERVMLGDAGANGLGALAGCSAVQSLPLWAVAALGALLAALHVWAEGGSISRWIEGRPWARALDRWGTAVTSRAGEPESE